jgi:hypothetical protein
MRFKVGDCVAWRSQAGGIWKCKIGIVVARVEPLQDPSDALREALGYEGSNPRKDLRFRVEGMLRVMESYLIQATPEGKRRARLYWPRTSALRSCSCIDGTC